MIRFESVYSAIGRRIREEREAQGLSQEDLAKAVGLTRTSITNIEAGRQRMLVHTVYDIANALGVSVSRLLSIEDYQEHKHNDQRRLVRLAWMLPTL